MRDLHLSSSKSRVYGCTCETLGPSRRSALDLPARLWFELTDLGRLGATNLEADHRVIRYDLPGFGLTGADPTADYSDRRSIAVLLALMDRLGVCAGIRRRQLDGRPHRLDLRCAESEPHRQVGAHIAGWFRQPRA